MPKISTYRTLSLTLLTLLGVAGCERGPAEPAIDDPGLSPNVAAASILEGSYNPDALITCIVTVGTAKVACTSPQDPDPNVLPPPGGRGLNARLVTGSPAYVADSAYFRANFRVQNLMLHAIGSRDGPVSGLKPFFYEAPVVTEGSGTVTVANATGTAEFTAPGQQYFLYNSRVESQLQTSNLQWRFNVPGTVSKFRFKIYVSGYILPMFVFDMETAGNRDIYRANLDGTGITRLTTHSAVEMDPTVRKDTVLYVSYRNGNAEIYQQRLRGGPEVRITNTPWNETHPEMSPNALQIAHVNDQTGLPRIRYMNRNGSNSLGVTPLGHGGSLEAYPTWLSNTRIVYTSTAPGSPNLYRLDLPDGTPLLLNGGTPKFEAAANHTGTLMAYSSTPNTEIYLYNPTGGTHTRFTTRNDPDLTPTFTHDGRVLWRQGLPDNTYRLRWSTVDGSRSANVIMPLAVNPAGVPLL